MHCKVDFEPTLTSWGGSERFKINILPRAHDTVDQKEEFYPGRQVKPRDDVSKETRADDGEMY